MRSRHKEMLEKSVAAMVAAIEIYNKPNFKYREEIFSILAVNSWELITKSYILKLSKNKLQSIYALEKTKNKKGIDLQRPRFKRNRSGNPITHNLDFSINKMVA